VPEVLRPPAMAPTQSHRQPIFLGSFSCIFEVLVGWTTFSSRFAWFLPSSAAFADVVVETGLAHDFGLNR